MIHLQVQLPPSLVQSSIPLLFSSTCHNIEFILQVELPHIHSAFRISGFPPAQVCNLIGTALWGFDVIGALTRKTGGSACKLSLCLLTVFQICQHWLRQCFWNYLDWLEICQYVCLCVTLGIDYQVYMCVAILRAQCRLILQHTQQKDLIVFLKVHCMYSGNVPQSSHRAKLLP